jgi:hypothetical protein
MEDLQEMDLMALLTQVVVAEVQHKLLADQEVVA